MILDKIQNKFNAKFQAKVQGVSPEFNSSITSGIFTDGVSWSPTQMTSLSDGSYIGSASKFNDRRIVGSNGVAVMVGGSVVDADTLSFSSVDSELLVRAGFGSLQRFSLSPDLWYMNSDRSDGSNDSGINWPLLQMHAWQGSSGGTTNGNYFGRASILVGRTFMALNGATCTITTDPSVNLVEFTTPDTEATFRAGFEFPNMWREVI